MLPILLCHTLTSCEGKPVVEGRMEGMGITHGSFHMSFIQNFPAVTPRHRNPPGHLSNLLETKLANGNINRFPWRLCVLGTTTHFDKNAEGCFASVYKDTSSDFSWLPGTIFHFISATRSKTLPGRPTSRLLQCMVGILSALLFPNQKSA